ncbi:MAG: hypothetical protein H6Q74_2156 [Firmicutes bacterium]|nr:hypothetical protein [Bacillota bacterium]
MQFYKLFCARSIDNKIKEWNIVGSLYDAFFNRSASYCFRN